MGEKYYLFFLLIILLNDFSSISTNNSIIIPLFYSNNIDKNINFIELLFHPQLYTKIKLGYPEQNIYLLISTDTDYFSIESDDINPKFYDSNISSTFIHTNIKLSYYNERYKLGFMCLDQFYFINNMDNIQEEVFKNISFDYIYELNREYNINEKKFYIDNDNNEISGIIGLQLPKSLIYSNFLIRLNNVKAINKNIWSLFFLNSKPYLILGEDPYIKNYEDAKRTNSYSSNYYHYWYFLFRDIMAGNTKLNEERVAEYSPQFGGIIGSKEYKNYIKSNFFDNLIKNKKCIENNTTLNYKIYSYYECDIDISLKDFENLEFIHQELSYNFILDKDDLFVDFNNKKYFLCIFLEEDIKHSYLTSNNWVFGIPFVKKYHFVFDQDKKLIFFYEKNIKDIDKNIETNKDNNTFSIGIIIVLGVLTGIIIIYFIIKIILKPKQIKANELEDSFSYRSQEKMNNKDIMNSIYNSKYNQLGI